MGHYMGHYKNPNISEKSSLAQGLEDMAMLKSGAGSPGSCSQGSMLYSPDLSPLPSLPSTPSEYVQQTPQPTSDQHDTPTIQFEITQVHQYTL